MLVRDLSAHGVTCQSAIGIGRDILQLEEREGTGSTVWAILKAESTYFDPSLTPFVLDSQDALLASRTIGRC
jgi:hypothetical protein